MNFRRLKNIKVEFQRGLNVIVGPNNIGKTAVVDALRALLTGTDGPYTLSRVGNLNSPLRKGSSIQDTKRIEYVNIGIYRFIMSNQVRNGSRWAK